MSPALAGRFSTTAPPEKAYAQFNNFSFVDFFFFPGIEKQDKKTTGAGSSRDTSLSAIFRGEFLLHTNDSVISPSE